MPRTKEGPYWCGADTVPSLPITQKLNPGHTTSCHNMIKTQEPSDLHFAVTLTLVTHCTMHIGKQCYPIGLPEGSSISKSFGRKYEAQKGEPWEACSKIQGILVRQSKTRLGQGEEISFKENKKSPKSFTYTSRPAAFFWNAQLICPDSSQEKQLLTTFHQLEKRDITSRKVSFGWWISDIVSENFQPEV